MKKIIFTAIIMIISNISLSFAGNFNSNWGVVLEVIPVSVTKIISKPYVRKTCNQVNTNHLNNFSDIAIGGLIGSVVGNTLSNNHGSGTIGAVFGSLLAAGNSNNYVAQDCYEQTYYSNQNIQQFSHYNIKVKTKRRTVFVKSNIPYNVHDVFYFN